MMKAGITFAEIRSLVVLLKRYEGGYIEKNYFDQVNISLKFRKSGFPSLYLHFMNYEFLFTSKENLVDGKKNAIPVENMQISSIRQLGTDRALIIEGPKNIIIEMMGGGNFFVTENSIILYSMKVGKRKGIILKKGEKYIEPDIIDLESSSFPLEKNIRESKGDAVRTLATRVGLSKYSEEILCALGNNIRTNVELLDKLDEVKSLIGELLQKSSDGNIYIYKDKFLVWKSKCTNDNPEIMNIEEGLRRVYELSISNNESREISIRRDMARMQEEMERLKAMGQFIMSNLSEIDHFLLLARKNSLDPRLIDYERGIATYVNGNTTIPLKITLSAGENASEFFNSSKKIKDKLSRVKIGKSENKNRETKITVHRIFSNYRWFVTSEGNLVLAGKDAATNDSVVKKYLDEKDLYFHADIHGAPSVVLKNRNGIGEKSILEAAQFAWCMSRAWGSQFGNGAVFYVTKSQVSKTPETGEYLARGAWVIRGKKNFITHLELELAVGFQKYENRDYLVAAPSSAISGNSIVIIPGDGREEIVKKISEYFKVEKEVVYPILPPGGMDIKEIIKTESEESPGPEDGNDNSKKEADGAYNSP